MPDLIESVHIIGFHSLVDGEVGRAADEVTRDVTNAEGRWTRAETRHDCYGLYVVTPRLQEPIPDSTRFPWREAHRAQPYCLSMDALQPPPQVREATPPYGGKT